MVGKAGIAEEGVREMGGVHNDFVGWSRNMMRLEKKSLFFLVSKKEMGLKP